MFRISKFKANASMDNIQNILKNSYRLMKIKMIHQMTDG